MNLYIEEENGIAKNHPALEENLLQVWGCIPDHWKPFTRIPKPNEVYKVYSDEPRYECINGGYIDVWDDRDMTAEERIKVQNVVKEMWQKKPNRENFSTWVFDETLCRYVAPVPKPEGGFIWSGVKNNWVEVPPYPNDGKLYTFDILTESWITNE